MNMPETLQSAMINVHRAPPDGLSSPDVYFLAGYGRAAAMSKNGEWVLLEAFDGAWQLPLILRTVGDGARDACSPYGYSGVYASPDLSSQQIKQAWSGTLDTLRAMGVISVLLRHSPLVPQAPGLRGLRPIISGHPTIALEHADGDSAWRAMEANCRNRTRKALKNGYTGEVRDVSSEDLASGGDFRRLYEQTMQRRDAAPYYFFGDDYYQELLGGLGQNLLICEVRDQGGAVVSSTLLMRHAHRLHYHLAGSNIDDARMGSNNLMLWTATQFAIAEGITQFHLGGGVGPDDGLFTFKRSFGGRQLEFGVSGVIIDDESYQAHTRKRAVACGTSATALSGSSFFPAYRAGTVREGIFS
jgi:hypothetical protein